MSEGPAGEGQSKVLLRSRPQVLTSGGADARMSPDFPPSMGGISSAYHFAEYNMASLR